MNAGYVTVSGHGSATTLAGWGNEPVLSTEQGAAKFAAAEAAGKIFHIYGCTTGNPGTEAALGLGKALVDAGAVGFFGYTADILRPMSNPPTEDHLNFYKELMQCDLVIDYWLLSGTTCQIAFDEAKKKYKELYDKMRVKS